MDSKILHELSNLIDAKIRKLYKEFYPYINEDEMTLTKLLRLFEGDIATGQKTEEEIIRKINKLKNSRIMAKESFKQKLAKTGKGVLDERASQLAQMTKIEAVNALNQQKAMVLRIEGQIASHQDLAIKNTQSLTVGDKDFDSKKWVDEEIKLKQALRVARIEYKITKEWYEELFPESDDIELDDINVEE